MFVKYEFDHYLIYNHENRDSLPIDGWFHNCIYCNSVSASEVGL